MSNLMLTLTAGECANCGSTAETVKCDGNPSVVCRGSTPSALNVSDSEGSHCEKTPEGVRL
jgi:hypothetical protein